jgi:hypothetical protein
VSAHEAGGGVVIAGVVVEHATQGASLHRSRAGIDRLGCRRTGLTGVGASADRNLVGTMSRRPLRPRFAAVMQRSSRTVVQPGIARIRRRYPDGVSSKSLRNLVEK